MEWDGKYEGYIHDENNIKGFSGDYSWLSNFYPCKVIYEEIEYCSSENAYQASKTNEKDVREYFQNITPAFSKKLAKKNIITK